MERSALALQTIEDAAIIGSLQRIGYQQNLRILRLMTNDEQIGDSAASFRVTVAPARGERRSHPAWMGHTDSFPNDP